MSTLLLILILYYYSLFARVLFWLSLWQQKEYRLDRLQAYLKSPDGRQQLATIFHFPLSKETLKRPKITPKSILILFLTVLLILVTDKSSTTSLLALYIFSPAYILVASIPAWIVTSFINYRLRIQAKNLFSLHHPRVIGITGSYGKTTTKQILAHLLSTKHKVLELATILQHPSLPHQNFHRLLSR